MNFHLFLLKELGQPAKSMARLERCVHGTRGGLICGDLGDDAHDPVKDLHRFTILWFLRMAPGVHEFKVGHAGIRRCNKMLR